MNSHIEARKALLVLTERLKDCYLDVQASKTQIATASSHKLELTSLETHLWQGRKQAKYWIEPLALAWMRGYRQQELNEIERLIRDNEELIRAVWQRESEKRK